MSDKVREMTFRVGMPQALLYHEFGRLWTAFFRGMDVEVTESGATTRPVLDRGTALSIDESCLPLKVYLGHVDSLLNTCSHIFVPRITQYYPDHYLCAKFAGLPDVVHNTFRLPPDRLISPHLVSRSSSAALQAVHSVCQYLGIAPVTGQKAYHRALAQWRQNPPAAGRHSPGTKVAVVGHSYILEDAFFSEAIMSPLRAKGIIIVTPQDMPAKQLYTEAAPFRRDIYWQLSAKLAGAVRFFCRQDDIAGLILVSSFGCGPDSLVNEYLEHHVLKGSDKPYMILNVDEHTGTAGILTRVEAFWDMAERRNH